LGTAVGAGSGLLFGTASGAEAGAGVSKSLQWRYDVSYMQCIWETQSTPGHAHGPPVQLCAAAPVVRQAFEQLTEELFGRVLIPPLLHQYVEYVPLLVHRPPEIVPLTTSSKKDLVQVPLIARPGTPAA
jgi:hypothetical protein